MPVKHTEMMYKGHRGRMRQRFMKNGDVPFEDVKLLEILLYDLLPRIDTFPVATNLLEKFGDLDGVFSASPSELCKVEGVGEKTAFSLYVIGRTFNRMATEVFSAYRFDSYEAIHSYIIWILRNEEPETIALLYLSESGELIESIKYPKSKRNRYKLSEDIRNYVAVNKVSRIVLAHKHPDDCLRPSSEDIESTSVFYELCKDIGVRAEEHFIVSGNSVLPIIARVTGQKTELFEKSI